MTSLKSILHFLILITLFSCQEYTNSKPAKINNSKKSKRIAVEKHFSNNKVTSIKEEQSNDNVINSTIRKSFLRSKPFEINNLKCFWEYTIKGNEYRMNLVNLADSAKILASADEMMVGVSDISLDSTRKKDFKDINFDGYKDFVEERPDLSGSGGILYFVYIFNPSINKFELSDTFSGTDIRIDKEK